MTNIERPNLDQLDPATRDYIEALEAELERLRQGRRRPQRSAEPVPPSNPSEPPTTINVITINADGIAKRTPRHLYTRQARGGMGVFDLETPENAPPAFLVTADESQHLVLVTDQGRGFRLPVKTLPESPVRSRGQSIVERLSLNPGERLSLVFPDEGGTYAALLTQRGHVLWFSGHLFGKRLLPGTILYEARKFGPPSAACWTPNDGELFIATRQGRAIRFSTRQVPVRGCLGIRLGRDDVAVAITPVRPNSGVFIISADGKGTIRMMSGFRANKSPGAGGKVALKTDCLVGAVAVTDDDDVFAISRLSKLIRFPSTQVPPKEGVVQGVNCMALRADETVSMMISQTLIPGDDTGE